MAFAGAWDELPGWLSWNASCWIIGMVSNETNEDVTVSHAIVILLALTCQLAPKSNSHISQSFVASVYKAAFFQCLFSSSSTLCSNVSRSLLE